MTSEQKQAVLEALKEAITRICQRCKDEGKSGKKTLQGAGKRVHHRLASNEIVDCKASPLHLMVLEISQQETD